MSELEQYEVIHPFVERDFAQSDEAQRFFYAHEIANGGIRDVLQAQISPGRVQQKMNMLLKQHSRMRFHADSRNFGDVAGYEDPAISTMKLTIANTIGSLQILFRLAESHGAVPPFLIHDMHMRLVDFGFAEEGDDLFYGRALAGEDVDLSRQNFVVTAQDMYTQQDYTLLLPFEQMEKVINDYIRPQKVGLPFSERHTGLHDDLDAIVAELNSIKNPYFSNLVQYTIIAGENRAFMLEQAERLGIATNNTHLAYHTGHNYAHTFLIQRAIQDQLADQSTRRGTKRKVRKQINNRLDTTIERAEGISPLYHHVLTRLDRNNVQEVLGGLMEVKLMNAVNLLQSVVAVMRGLDPAVISYADLHEHVLQSLAIQRSGNRATLQLHQQREHIREVLNTFATLTTLKGGTRELLDEYMPIF